METFNYYNYCALVILMVLIVSISARHMLRGRRNQYFWNLLCVVLCSVIFDILSVNLDNGAAANPIEKYIAHGGYLIMHNLTVPVYVLYLACLTDTMHKVEENFWVQLFLALPFWCVLELVLTSPVFHTIYYLDEQYKYVQGPWYNILYACASFYIAIGVVYTLRCRKLFAKGQVLSLLAVYPVLLIALAFQVLYPQWRIEMFAHTAGLLFMLLMIQKPEERNDPLTGFGTQKAFAEDMEQAVNNKKPIQIILINILNYKSLSDILGYENTNALMKTVAMSLENLCEVKIPKIDPYYLGRGRFCLVAGKDKFEKVGDAAETINEMLQKDVVLRKLDIDLIGNVCVVRYPEDMPDFQSLMSFCGEFEDYNKAGKVVYAEHILKDGSYIQRDIETIVNNAIENNQLAVYYQPIYSVKKKRFVSAEALLRIEDEKYGNLSPELFIPVAEKNGAIHQIGTFVLDQVCRFVGTEEFNELGLEYIELNLSVVQCMRSDLPKEVLDIMDRYSVRPEQINLEITETAAAYSQNTMTENIFTLSRAGVPFSLDDFGTGYSNIRRMASLPFNIVKLDKTFTDMEGNPKLEIVVRNTVRMLKDMDLEIVVEGVETEKLAKHFADLECEYIQGYYYSRPLSKENFVKFLRDAQNTQNAG